MTDSIPKETGVLPFSGRVCEVGREGGQNFAAIDVGRGQIVRITGISDTVVRSFARAIFRPVTVEVEVHDE